MASGNRTQCAYGRFIESPPWSFDDDNFVKPERDEFDDWDHDNEDNRDDD